MTRITTAWAVGGSLLPALLASAEPATGQNTVGGAERDANRAASSLYSFINRETRSAPADSAARVENGSQVIRQADGSRCTTDLLVHAEVSPNVSAHIVHAVKLQESGSRIRDVAKLVLPCGFHVDNRYSFNLILNNGREPRRYDENNPFGFAPAFGFGGETSQPYTLRSEPVSKSGLTKDGCAQAAQDDNLRLQLCSGFGSATSFFATTTANGKTTLAHYLTRGAKPECDFVVAETAMRITSLSFLPPPDAAGSTLTLILQDQGSTYRAYIDSTRG